MDNPLFFNNTKQKNMRVIFTFCLLLSLSLTSYSQLFNDGATIVVESGAILHVETDITNSNGGTITNSGTIEVTGNFTNNATYTANSSSIKFIGSTPATVKTNGDVFNNVEINKSAGDITLTDDMGLSGILNWAGNGVILTGANKVDVQNSASGAITGYTAARYINGNLTRDVVNGGDYPLPVGDASAMRLAEIEDIQGASELNAAFSAGVAGNTGLNITQEGIYTAVDNFGKWTISSTGTASSYDVKAHTAGFGAVADGQFGVVKRATGSTSGADWGTGGGTFVSRTAAQGYAERSDITDGFSEFGIATGATVITSGIKVDLTAFLEGPYTTGSTMGTGLSGLIPTTDPYGLGITVGAVPAGVVDWVKIELRSSTGGATEVGETAGFLMSDGTIVSTDGLSELNVPFADAGTGPYYIVVNHRNHMKAMSNAGINASSSKFTHDYGVAGSSYNAGFPNTPTKAMTDGVFALFVGDMNQDGFIFASDVSAVAVVLNTIFNAYSIYDSNFDKFVFASDVSKVAVNLNTFGHVPN